MEPKSGFTPHGTPESSLAVTATSGSSESGAPQPQQPSRVMPAVPALPTRQEERSDSSRHSSSSSTSSSRRTTSTDLLRRAEHRKLLAALEMAQAKQEAAAARHALAEAEETNLLEKMSHRSSRSSKSRSTRGVRSSGVASVLSRKVIREKETDPNLMHEDSINRFKAAYAQCIDSLEPVIEEVTEKGDDGRDTDDDAEQRLHPVSHLPSGHAYPSASPNDLDRSTSGLEGLGSELDRSTSGFGPSLAVGPSVGSSLLEFEHHVSDSQTHDQGTCDNPYLNVFKSSTAVSLRPGDTTQSFEGSEVMDIVMYEHEPIECVSSPDVATGNECNLGVLAVQPSDLARSTAGSEGGLCQIMEGVQSVQFPDLIEFGQGGLGLAPQASTM